MLGNKQVFLYRCFKDTMRLTTAPNAMDIVYDKDRIAWDAERMARDIQTNLKLFHPIAPLASPYVQMLMHVLNNRNTLVTYERFTAPFSADGEMCVLDVAYPEGMQQQGNPHRVLFVCHGLGGNSDSCDCRKIAKDATQMGYTVVIYNRRGQVMPNRSNVKPYPRHYDKEDMDDAIALMKRVLPDRISTVGMGISMGSNLIVKYAGQVPGVFDAIISVANGFDLERGIKLLHRQRSDADRIAVDYIGDIIELHPHLRDDPHIRKILRTSHSFLDADTRIMRHVYGIDFDMDAYYREISCIHELDKVDVPVIALACEDDPFLCGQVPSVYSLITRLNPQQVLSVTTRLGGHVGWHDCLSVCLHSLRSFDKHE